MLKYSEDANQIVPVVKLEQVLIFSTKDVNTGFPGHNVQPTEPYFDVTSLVEELHLTESIYSIAIGGHVLLVDGLNMFEEMSINGQEMVYVHLKRPFVDDNAYGSGVFSGTTDIKKYFYVSNMSLYDRQANKQLYKLELISPHAYRNTEGRINRPYGFRPQEGGEIIESAGFRTLSSEIPDFKYKDGETIDRPEQMVWHILTEDLGYPSENIFIVDETTPIAAESERPMKVIIPNWRPFTAISWLMNNTFHREAGGVTFPWLAYETILSGIRIEPWNVFRTEYSPDAGFWESMGREGKVIDTPFVYSSFFKDRIDPTGGSTGYWEEERRRILELNVGFSFNRYDQALYGVFRTENAYINPSIKTFTEPGKELLTETIFDDNAFTSYGLSAMYGAGEHLPLATNLDGEAPQLAEKNDFTYYTIYNNVLHGEPEPDDESFQNPKETRPYNYGFRAEDPLDEDKRYYWQSLADMIKKNSAWMKHVMKVRGDLFLSPGIRITIEVPKAIDPKLLEGDGLKADYMNKQIMEDEYVSGEYYILGVTHVLDTKGYVCECTIARDFSTVDLDSATGASGVGSTSSSNDRTVVQARGRDDPFGRVRVLDDVTQVMNENPLDKIRIEN